MPKESRRLHGQPCCGRLRRVHARWRRWQPRSMRCAACGCHRNFHRKEADGGGPGGGVGGGSVATPIFHPSPLQQASVIHPHLQQRFSHYTPGKMMAFAESSSEDLALFRSAGYAGGDESSRKRLRTKFTQEQKEKMTEFAEKIGWRIQKQDEDEVQQFCLEAGVRRQVFKVWMHNNKQAMKRKH